VSRRSFWPLIALGTIAAALGAAFVGFAVANRDYTEPTETRGWTNYVPLADSENEACFSCADPLPWLIAGVVFLVAALGPFLLAARRR
jgi:hypothetical protein